MPGFAHIKRCLELSDRDLLRAMEDRPTCRALLERLAEISRPGDGAPKLLLVFARMASLACDWVDGDLRVEILGNAESTVIDVLCELGAGMRERVFPSFEMRVPLDEFARAVERVPHMIAPLTVVTRSPRRLVMSATEEVRKSSLPPPMVEISAESLYDVPPPSSLGSFAPPRSHVPPAMKAPAVPRIEPTTPRVQRREPESVAGARPRPQIRPMANVAKGEAPRIAPKSEPRPDPPPSVAPRAPRPAPEIRRIAAPNARAAEPPPPPPSRASKRPSAPTSDAPDDASLDGGWDDE